MSTPRRLWIDKTGQPVVTMTANGERDAQRWGWTPAMAVPSGPAPALSAVPDAAVEAATTAVRREPAFSAAASFGVPLDDVPQCAEMIAHAALTAALPILTSTLPPLTAAPKETDHG